MNRFAAVLFGVLSAMMPFSSLAFVRAIGVVGSDPYGDLHHMTFAQRRVPAEWEPHEATWMQWQKIWEATYREPFSRIIDVLQDYEPVDIVVASASAEKFEFSPEIRDMPEPAICSWKGLDILKRLLYIISCGLVRESVHGYEDRWYF